MTTTSPPSLAGRGGGGLQSVPASRPSRGTRLPPASLQLSFGPLAATLEPSVQRPPLVSSSYLSLPKHKLTLSPIPHFLPVSGWLPSLKLFSSWPEPSL